MLRGALLRPLYLAFRRDDDRMRHIRLHISHIAFRRPALHQSGATRFIFRRRYYRLSSSIRWRYVDDDHQPFSPASSVFAIRDRAAAAFHCAIISLPPCRAMPLKIISLHGQSHALLEHLPHARPLRMRRHALSLRRMPRRHDMLLLLLIFAMPRHRWRY